MTDCTFCHQPVLPAHGISQFGNHRTCADELLERNNNDACVKCGQNDMGSLGNTCGPCRERDAGYRGYPGP